MKSAIAQMKKIKFRSGAGAPLGEVSGSLLPDESVEGVRESEGAPPPELPTNSLLARLCDAGTIV
jgi:hypothetical protein